MSLRRLQLHLMFTLGLAAALTVGATASAAADLPTRGVLPPAQCPNACARGQFLMAQQKYADAAEAFDAAARHLPAGEASWRARIDLVVLAARARELAGQPGRAGLGYLMASRLDDDLQAYLRFKATQNLARVAHPPYALLRRLVAGGALAAGYAGSALVAAQIEALMGDGLPSPAAAARALTGDARAQACQWLSERLVADHAKSGDGNDTSDKRAAVANKVYGYCLPDEIADGFEQVGVEPTASMRLERAEHWYHAVRFSEAYDELKEVDTDKLEPADHCRARFRRGRTLYRLRKRSASIKAYEQVIDHCKTPANEDERVSALYAVGKMLFWRDHFANSKKHFETLLADYPERSHADDALLYLARIARHQSEPKTEAKLVARALAKYPDGDMVHEIVWEYAEADYRAGKYKAFLAKLDALELPEFDPQYFSQGRLEYFSGIAWQKLGRKERSRAAWQKAWKTYPFSFYGYLSRERLVEAGAKPASLDAGAAGAVADWFLTDGWADSASGRLSSLGLYELAADAERAALRGGDASQVQRWRLAYLEHLAGRYPVSHNIARRRIPGRPWAQPDDARQVRWRIAWPNPFRADILRAIIAERRQADDGQSVQPALPAAIMREESSFIEDIESWAGALGLMQLMPATAAGHDDDIDGEASTKKLKTALVNIRVGVDLLFALARRFDSHPVLMTAAYNAGGGAVSGWIRRKKTSEIGLWVEDIPYDQTRNYTKRVIGSYAAYQWLSGIRDLDPSIAGDP